MSSTGFIKVTGKSNQTRFYIPPFESQEDWTEDNFNLVKSSIETGKITKHNVLRAIIGNQSKKRRRLENGELEPIYIFEILRDEKDNANTKENLKKNVNIFFENYSGFLKKFFQGSDLILSGSVDKKIDELFREYVPLPYNPDEIKLLNMFNVADPNFIKKKITGNKKNPEPTHYKQDDTTRKNLKTNINVFTHKPNSEFGLFKAKLIAYFKGKAKYDYFAKLYQTKYPTLSLERAGQVFYTELTKAISLMEKENDLFELLIKKYPDIKDSVIFSDKTAVQQVENHQSVENTFKSVYDDVSLYLAGPADLIREVSHYQKYLKYKSKYLALKSKLHM